MLFIFINRKNRIFLNKIFNWRKRKGEINQSGFYCLPLLLDTRRQRHVFTAGSVSANRRLGRKQRPSIVYECEHGHGISKGQNSTKEEGVWKSELCSEWHSSFSQRQQKRSVPSNQFHIVSCSSFTRHFLGAGEEAGPVEGTEDLVRSEMSLLRLLLPFHLCQSSPNCWPQGDPFHRGWRIVAGDCRCHYSVSSKWGPTLEPLYLCGTQSSGEQNEESYQTQRGPPTNPSADTGYCGCRDMTFF